MPRKLVKSKSPVKKAVAKKAVVKRAVVKKAAVKKAVVKRAARMATVCFEGYKISKDGRCIKDKSYAAPPKRAPKVATVCLEGYKISKDGRCIKDKSYQTVVSSMPLPVYGPEMKPASLRVSESASFGMYGPQMKPVSRRISMRSGIPVPPPRPISGFTVRAPVSQSFVQKRIAELTAAKKAVSSLSKAVQSPGSKTAKEAVAQIADAVQTKKDAGVIPQLTQSDVAQIGAAIQASAGKKSVSQKVAQETGQAFVEASTKNQILSA
jgi:hypothetical protein